MKKFSLLFIALVAITSAKADLVVDSLGTVHVGTLKATNVALGSYKITSDKIICNYSGEAINFDSYRGIYYTDFGSEALFESQRPQYGFSVGAKNAFTAYFYNGSSYPYPAITAQAKSNQGVLFMGRNANNVVTSKIDVNGIFYTASGVQTLAPINATRGSQVVTQSLDGINQLTPITYTLNCYNTSASIEEEMRQTEASNNSETMNLDKQSPICEIDSEILAIMNNELQRPKYGLDAQELARVFPNVVYTTSTGEKAIAYQELIPILVSAIQEQQELINNLTEEIEDIKQPATEQRRQAPASVQDAIADGSALLMQNTPNPFNQATEIGYRLPEGTATAMIMLCDMNGKMLQTYPLPVNTTAGTLTIQAGSYTPGMYLYTLLVDGAQIDTKQMIILAH